MGDITTADFERVPDTIPLGEAATREHGGRAARVSPCPRRSTRRGAKRVTQLAGNSRRGSPDVRFEGLKRVNPEFLASRDSIKAGDMVDSTTISTEAQRMSVLQDFDSVGYRLDGDPEAPILTWLPREKNWGPNYLRADLGLYTSLRWRPGVLAVRPSRAHLGEQRWAASGATKLQFGGETLFADELLPAAGSARTASSSSRASAYSRTFENIFLER